MGDIIQFPGFDERSWREFEPGLRDTLVTAGADTKAIDWVCADLKKRFLAVQMQMQPSFAIPQICEHPVKNAVDTCVKFMHEAMNRSLLQMVLLELELYYAKLAAA